MLIVDGLDGLEEWVGVREDKAWRNGKAGTGTKKKASPCDERFATAPFRTRPRGNDYSISSCKQKRWARSGESGRQAGPVRSGAKEWGRRAIG